MIFQFWLSRERWQYQLLTFVYLLVSAMPSAFGISIQPVVKQVDVTINKNKTNIITKSPKSIVSAGGKLVSIGSLSVIGLGNTNNNKTAHVGSLSVVGLGSELAAPKSVSIGQLSVVGLGNGSSINKVVSVGSLNVVGTAAGTGAPQLIKPTITLTAPPVSIAPKSIFLPNQNPTLVPIPASVPALRMPINGNSNPSVVIPPDAAAPPTPTIRINPETTTIQVPSR